MKETELMDAIVEVARDERQVDQLARLAAGELSEPERAELMRAAEQDPALMRVVELCEPKADAFFEQLADGAEQAMKVHTIRPTRALWIGGAGALAASLVAGFLLLGQPTPLPDYSGRVQVAVEYRSEDAAIEARVGDRFTMLLRPATRVGREVDAWLFVVKGDAVTPVDVTLERDASGAVRASGTVGSWGAAQIVAAVGDGMAPNVAQVQGRDPAWRWVVQPVQTRE
ncbi:MAG: hypothetical protein RMA76_25985 [Deltaproteobacteria bacterium]|jgi:hypothetical protein